MFIISNEKQGFVESGAGKGTPVLRVSLHPQNHEQGVRPEVCSPEWVEDLSKRWDGPVLLSFFPGIAGTRPFDGHVLLSLQRWFSLVGLPTILDVYSHVPWSNLSLGLPLDLGLDHVTLTLQPEPKTLALCAHGYWLNYADEYVLRLSHAQASYPMDAVRALIDHLRDSGLESQIGQKPLYLQTETKTSKGNQSLRAVQSLRQFILSCNNPNDLNSDERWPGPLVYSEPFLTLPPQL